ncbi:GNAT family N-acetyltransferase [Legionella pneumophila]
MNYKIEHISADEAELLCRQITTDLPEYFGLPECNEHYALGVRSRINFAAKSNETYVGLSSLDFPYPANSNIYWMGVLRAFHSQGIGYLLIQDAVKYARQQGASTMTVETLAPAESDENYLKTYNFYKHIGFNPLLNLKPAGYEWNMVYMALNLNQFKSRPNNETISIRAFVAEDIPLIVSNFAKHHWPKLPSTFEGYLHEQKLNERIVWIAFYKNEFAGYITLKWNSLYQSFKNQGIPEIMDLNVLPPYRNHGIASALLDMAELEAVKKQNKVGIGVGLYDGYGSAQRLYIKRGYIPDGLGVTYDYNHVTPGADVCLDDDLVLWFTKEFS